MVRRGTDMKIALTFYFENGATGSIFVEGTINVEGAINVHDPNDIIPKGALPTHLVKVDIVTTDGQAIGMDVMKLDRYLIRRSKVPHGKRLKVT